jgi:hypothetical protein
MQSPRTRGNLEVRMKCQCPACGRSTDVPEEQLDFLVRCDVCNTILLTRTSCDGLPESEAVPVEVVPLAEVAGRLRNTPAEDTHLDLADFMTRRQSSGRHAIVTSFRKPSDKPASKVAPKPAAPGSLGAAAYGLVLAVASFSLLAIVFLGTQGSFRTAHAAKPHAAVSHATPGPRPSKPAPATAPAGEQPVATGDGELFPDIPARK